MAEEQKTETKATKTTGKRRVLQGTVRSDKMQKTVVVEVTHRVLHRVAKPKAHAEDAASLVNHAVKYSCQRRQLRSGGLKPASL